MEVEFSREFPEMALFADHPRLGVTKHCDDGAVIAFSNQGKGSRRVAQSGVEAGQHRPAHPRASAKVGGRSLSRGRKVYGHVVSLIVPCLIQRAIEGFTLGCRGDDLCAPREARVFRNACNPSVCIHLALLLNWSVEYSQTALHLPVISV